MYQYRVIETQPDGSEVEIASFQARQAAEQVVDHWTRCDPDGSVLRIVEQSDD